MSEVRRFETPDVRKLSRVLRNASFEMARDFPNQEKFHLKDRVIRSIRGIGASMDEG